MNTKWVVQYRNAPSGSWIDFENCQSPSAAESSYKLMLKRFRRLACDVRVVERRDKIFLAPSPKRA